MSIDLHGHMLDRLGEAVIAFDPTNDRVLAVNPAACTLYGLSRDALLNSRFSALHPRQLPSLVVFSEAVMDKGRAWTRSLSLVDDQGKTRPLEYLAALMPWQHGTAIVAVVSDLEVLRRREVDTEAESYLRDGMEEWRRVEQVFRDIERHNQLILKAAGEGIYGVNSEGKTTFVNPAAERMLGWKAEELVGRNMHRTVHYQHRDGSTHEDSQCPIYSAFRAGITRHVDDDVFWRKDGTPIRIEYTSTPIRDRGAIVGAVIVFRDITQRKEAEEQLHAALQEVQSLRERLELENAYLQEEIRTERRHHEIIGASAATTRVLSQIDLVAATDATVLITGESGTGKELIARAVHAGSSRSSRPMIRVNCAAIPRELFESEFFGHVKGAFTGAVRDRVGRFELADGGTLFLDELGEIPPELQAKLLRVLQEGYFERIGEDRTRHVDVRVIAATNRDLKTEVQKGHFREDLFYRLNVFPIETVPLRERREDVAPLAQHILKRCAERIACPLPVLTRGNVEQLAAYDWPGNVRELENVIERAVILARNGHLVFETLGKPDTPPLPPSMETETAPSPAFLTESQCRERDRANLLAALRAAGGKVSGPGGAARLLGVKPTTLYSRLKALGVEAGC
ncbi:MAG: sigma 54-interacting transcriptional regulator [Magnetospirillum sp.]